MPGLFIVGCPRSGTTLLQHIMIAHPDVAIGLERYNLKVFAHKALRADFEKERFFAIEPGDTWYNRLDVFADEYKSILDKFETAKYHGDKIPRGYQHYPYLMRIFKDTRFLFMIRDIYSVAASYEVRRAAADTWSSEWDAKRSVEHWNESIASTLKFMNYMPILPVNYEMLRSAGSDAAEHIASFLEIDARPIREKVASEKRQRELWLSVRDRNQNRAQLSEEQKVYIAANANFTGYKKICELAASPPAYPTRRATRGLNSVRVDKYSAEDAKVVDYCGWQFPNAPYFVRGPKPAARWEDSIVCIGSAATFGRLVESPYSRQIERRLGVPVYNLGIGGARPATYLACAPLVDALARCKLAIVEVMSARSYGSSIFLPNNAHSGVGIPHGLDMGNEPPMFKDAYFIDKIYNTALKQFDANRLAKVTMEIRSAYVADMRNLGRLVAGKGVLLYLSQRPLDYRQEYASYIGWSAGFPHFIDRGTIDMFSDLFLDTVECVSTVGLPNTLVDRETKAPVAIFPGAKEPAANAYYPSPEMHTEAAEMLVPVIERILSQGK